MNSIWQAIANKLPRGLVYGCLIRAGAEVTTGKYGKTVVPELPFMVALQRWQDAS